MQNQFLLTEPHHTEGPGHSAGLQVASPRALPGQQPIREKNRDRELFLLSLAYGNKSNLEEKEVPAAG